MRVAKGSAKKDGAPFHKMLMKNQSKHENAVYAVLWMLLFAAPVLSLYVRTVSDSHLVFNWAEVLLVWRKFAIYLALFLLHNYLLAPLLMQGRRRWLYFSIVTAIVALFVLFQCSNKPSDAEPPRRPDMERPDMVPRDPELPDRNRPDMERPDMNRPDMAPSDMGRPEMGRQEPPPFERPPLRERQVPPLFMGELDIVAIVILLLIFGMNIGVKYYFRSRDDQKRLQALEKQNLEQQLEYLRYQINPHFFMNTLNNIHALVDIDSEKAKDTIIELSKMMRFVLYEGNKQGVPLSRELDFIHHYVTLMKLRYTEKVTITMNLPQDIPDRQIPPLILITFIENAFKHGISYQHDSFIEVKMLVEHPSPHACNLSFTCRNSKAEKPNEEKGGVGLNNVRQRLHLLYGNHYTLNIEDAPSVYTVELNIPLT